MYENIHNSTTHNHQKPQTTQTFINGRMNELRHTNRIEYYRATKMTELFHATIWIKIANMLSKRSQTQENA